MKLAGLEVGSWADWISGTATICAIFVTFFITRYQINSASNRDRENFFIQEEYKMLDKLHARLIDSIIRLNVVDFNIDNLDIVDFYQYDQTFYNEYYQEYLVVRDNFNYILSKLTEYAKYDDTYLDMRKHTFNNIVACSSKFNVENIRLRENIKYSEQNDSSYSGYDYSQLQSIVKERILYDEQLEREFILRKSQLRKMRS